MIDSFKDQYRFLSNFYPVKVELDGVDYPSVEHAYQAAKTTDQYMRNQIRMAYSPFKAKKIGKFINVRPNLKNMRIDIMRDLVRKKFRDGKLALQLYATGNELLVEGNNWNDTYWGMCGGVGENHLGKILMEVRSEIRRSREAVRQQGNQEDTVQQMR